MSAAARDGQPQDHRPPAQVCQEHPEDHPVHEDGGYRTSLTNFISLWEIFQVKYFVEPK